jgi:hypothetical protein
VLFSAIHRWKQIQLAGLIGCYKRNNPKNPKNPENPVSMVFSAIHR